VDTFVSLVWRSDALMMAYESDRVSYTQSARVKSIESMFLSSSAFPIELFPDLMGLG
jgi:hypothetical protein